MVDMQVVVFKLIDELCGVETEQVREIMKYQEITKIPEMPTFVEGIINLRGHVIPVINLNKRFHLGQIEADNSTKIIITSIEQQQVGFVVDDVLEIVRLSKEETEETPQIIQRLGKKYVKCVAKIKGKLVNVLDLTDILTEEELGHISSL